MKINPLDFIHTLLPHHLLSRLVARLAKSRKKWLKNLMISWVMDHFEVDMSEATCESPLSYATFNDFFTRQLKPELRPIAKGKNNIVSPSDGFVIQKGPIKRGQLFQAKGLHYPLIELVGGEGPVADFKNGHFLSIYLAPKNYHRVHMPMTGTLKSTTYVPGSLFSVNPRHINRINRLFCRNERLVCLFETACGPMYLIFVGASLVGGIHTQWSGQVAPSHINSNHHQVFKQDQPHFKTGDEIGHFCYGSTVIVLWPEITMNWQENLDSDQALQMGQLVAKWSCQ